MGTFLPNESIEGPTSTSVALSIRLETVFYLRNARFILSVSLHLSL